MIYLRRQIKTKVTAILELQAVTQYMIDNDFDAVLMSIWYVILKDPHVVSRSLGKQSIFENLSHAYRRNHGLLCSIVEAIKLYITFPSTTLDEYFREGLKTSNH